MSCENGVKSILGCIDSVLGARDEAGAALKDVYVVTRTWTGKVPGDGYPKDKEVHILPSPRVRDFSHSIRLMEAGAIKSGDIILEGISKHKYCEKDINGISGDDKIEKFFRVGTELYKVISIVEKHLWFNVQLRRLSAQERHAKNG